MNGELNIDDLISGSVDCHVHSYPDVIDRKETDISLASKALERGMGGLVLKCHFGCTCERAWHLNQLHPELRVFGGLVLNNHVGGFNPMAVDMAIRMGAREIWMPTKSAANHQEYLGGSDGISIFKDNRLRPEIHDILQLIADSDTVLATGHLAPAETEVLVEEALARGVNRISITHPEWGVTAIPVETQRKFATTGKVFMERCLVSCESNLPHFVDFSLIASQIAAVGVDSTIAATDYGKPEYASPVDGMRIYAQRLFDAGFTVAAIKQMISENPRRLIGLDSE